MRYASKRPGAGRTVDGSEAPASQRPEFRLSCSGWKEVDLLYKERVLKRTMTLPSRGLASRLGPLRILLALPTGDELKFDSDVVGINPATSRAPATVQIQFHAVVPGRQREIKEMLTRLRNRVVDSTPRSVVPTSRDDLDNGSSATKRLDEDLARLKILPDHLVLGVAAGADGASLRRAYYKQCRHFHPDRYQDEPAASELAEQAFVLIERAYNRLRAGR